MPTDPTGLQEATTRGSDEDADSLLGVAGGFATFLVVSAVVVGLLWAVGAVAPRFLPEWLVPLVDVVVFAVVAVAATWTVFRVLDRR